MNPHVNLMPYQNSRRLLIRRRLRQWFPVWSAVVVVAAIFCGWKFLRHIEAHEELTQLEQLEVPSRQRMEAVVIIRQRLVELKERESLLKTLNSTGRPLQLMGIIGQAAGLADGGLCINNLHLSTIHEPAARSSTPRSEQVPSAVERMELNLEGTAINDLTVAGFVAAVEESGVFDNVTLESSIAAATDDGTRNFKLVCSYH